MKRLAVLLAVTATLAPGFALAAPEHLATIEAECAERMSMPPGGCACLKARVATLNEGQQAFIAATLTKNKPLQQEIMQPLTGAELSEVGLFMTATPVQCARGQ